MRDARFLAAFLFSFSLSFSSAYMPWIFTGTTPNIKEIIIGRCNQYQELNFQNRNPALYMDVDCKQVWDLFNSSFSFKDSCRSGEINDTSYDPLFKIINNKKLLNDQVVVVFPFGNFFTAVGVIISRLCWRCWVKVKVIICFYIYIYIYIYYCQLNKKVLLKKTITKHLF